MSVWPVASQIRTRWQPGSLAQRRKHAPQGGQVHIAADTDLPPVAKLDLDQTRRTRGPDTDAGRASPRAGIAVLADASACTGTNIGLAEPDPADPHAPGAAM